MSDMVSVTKARGGEDFEPRRKAEMAVFIREISRGASTVSAARAAGVPADTARRWLSQPGVIHAVHEARCIIIRSDGASAALRTLLAMVEDPATPASARLGAAKELLALAGHSAAQAATDAAAGRATAALQDMSADQLERMIAGAAATLQQLRRQASVVDVAPDPAPAPPDPASLL